MDVAQKKIYFQIIHVYDRQNTSSKQNAFMNKISKDVTKFADDSLPISFFPPFLSVKQKQISAVCMTKRMQSTG